MVPESGVILNNQMNDFSIPGATNAFGYRASPANYVRPGKRGLSSIAPVIVERRRRKEKNKKKGEPSGEDGEDNYGDEWGLYAVLGAAGGSRIITAVVQNVIDLLSPALSPSITTCPLPSSSSTKIPSRPPEKDSRTFPSLPSLSLLKYVLYRPRLHDQLLPNVLKMEKGGWGDDASSVSSPSYKHEAQEPVHEEVVEARNSGNASAVAIARALEKKGHVVEWTERGYSACQAVLFDDGEEQDGSAGTDENKGMRMKRSGHRESMEGRGTKGRWFAEGDPRQRDSGGSIV